MALHRVQVDFDVEADTHEDAVRKVGDFVSAMDLPDLHDVTILEEDLDEHCPNEYPEAGNFYQPNKKG